MFFSSFSNFCLDEKERKIASRPCLLFLKESVKRFARFQGFIKISTLMFFKLNFTNSLRSNSVLFFCLEPKEPKVQDFIKISTLMLFKLNFTSLLRSNSVLFFCLETKEPKVQDFIKNSYSKLLRTKQNKTCFASNSILFWRSTKFFA